jgi:ferric-dicitrate binding protein FerR (iron transport regulator)
MKTTFLTSPLGKSSFFRSHSPKLSAASLILSFVLAYMVFSAQAAFSASTPGASRASAIGVSGANAQLNGTRLDRGATLFGSDVVTLGTDSSAALQFGNGLVLVAPSTELVVESEGISLRNGRLQIRSQGGNAFHVSGPFFRVNVAVSDGVPSSVEIRVSAKQAQISAVTGTADILTAGNETPYRLRAGDVANLEALSGQATAPQAGTTPTAGQISRMVPEVQINRASLRLAAAALAPLFWNDELQSGPTGRAHVTLNDGSLLNLGSSSSLRILQHDAQSQQTVLDLAVGRMRGKVMKLTRPSAKFEIRTPAGAAGLVGTDFYLLATPDFTELIVFEGAVSFTNLAGNQAGITTANMKLVILRDGTFQGPSPATPQEMQYAIDSTDISETVAERPTWKASPLLVPVLISAGTAAVVTSIILIHNGNNPVSPMAP